MIEQDTTEEQAYPATRKYVYLNTASCGLLSQGSKQVLQRAARDYSEQGSLIRDSWYKTLSTIREEAATFLGASSPELALIPSFTHGINQIARSLGKYTRVLVVADDYPALLLPWFHHGFEVQQVQSESNGSIPLETIESTIRKQRIQILAVSHVQYSSGYHLPLSSLSSICRRYGTLLVVDATQSMGMIPIDLGTAGVDILIGSSYKWLAAGLGSALLYVREDRHPDLLPLTSEPTTTDHTDRNSIHTPAFTPGTLELGHYNYFSLLVLQQALRELTAMGVLAIYERLLQLRARLLDALPKSINIVSDYSKDNQSAIVVVKGPDQAEERLRSRGIITSTRPKGLRISPHFYNSEKDIELLGEALTEISL